VKESDYVEVDGMKQEVDSLLNERLLVLKRKMRVVELC